MSMRHVHLMLTRDRQHTYDLHPCEHVFTLRRLIAEDYQVMESRLCLTRHGMILIDDDLLEDKDLIYAFVMNTRPSSFAFSK